MTDPRPVRRVIPTHEKRCVWMTAGILSYRICARDFDCENCLLDQALRQSCEARSASGLEPVPVLHLLHPAHTWVRVEPDGTLVAGLDDFGRRLVGLLTWVELPEVGEMVRQGGPLVRVSHGPHEVTLESPVTGRVTAVNDVLGENPSRINRSPYDAGWIVRIESSGLARDLPGLLFGRPVEAWLCDETNRLERALAEALDLSIDDADAPRLNDGGEMQSEFLRGIPREARSRILESFLRTEDADPSRWE